ncbi:t-SNARE [Spinellus fusiger]|nr:t-SNARE [Spinellus fusiger]
MEGVDTDLVLDKTGETTEKELSCETLNLSEKKLPLESMTAHTLHNFFCEIEKLKNQISYVNTLVDAIDKQHNAALFCYNEKQLECIGQELKDLKNESQQLNMTIRNNFKAMEKSNAQMKMDPDLHIRQSQTEAIRKRFMDTIQRYQSIETLYERKYNERIQRQIRIVKPEATEEEIDRWMTMDESPQIFAQSLIQASKFGHLNSVITEVRNRHGNIQSIEKTILDLHRLFMDMSMLVEQQDDILGRVDECVQDASYNIEQGNKNMIAAMSNAKKTRRRRRFCLAMGLLLMATFAVILGFFVIYKGWGTHHR